MEFLFLWSLSWLLIVIEHIGTKNLHSIQTMPSDFNSPLSPLVLCDLGSLELDCANTGRVREMEWTRRGDLRSFEMAIVLNGKALFMNDWFTLAGHQHLVWVWLASCFGKLNPFTSKVSTLTWTRFKVCGLTHIRGQICCFKGYVDSLLSVYFVQTNPLMCFLTVSAVFQWQLINV